jgi:hypothetical protein
MKNKAVFRIGLALLALSLSAGTVHAASIAILTGSFYTSNLKNDLLTAGQTVTEIGGAYTAASLAAYNAVIVYGNMNSANMTELGNYALGGGTVIETPWFWLNYSPTATLDIFSHGGGAGYSQSYPGIAVLAPADSLLSGVTFPVGPGGFNIGRTTGNTFIGGVTQVANWADGTAMIGHKAVGSGEVIGINMHVITSDTAFSVIDQPWATQLFVNAAHGVAVAPVPEPSTFVMLGCGLLGLLSFARRRAS